MCVHASYFERVSSQIDACVLLQPTAGSTALQGIRNVVCVAAPQVKQLKLLPVLERFQSLDQAAVEHRM
jgi:hypothetical protein